MDKSVVFFVFFTLVVLTSVVQNSYAIELTEKFQIHDNLNMVSNKSANPLDPIVLIATLLPFVFYPMMNAINLKEKFPILKSWSADPIFVLILGPIFFVVVTVVSLPLGLFFSRFGVDPITAGVAIIVFALITYTESIAIYFNKTFSITQKRYFLKHGYESTLREYNFVKWMLITSSSIASAFLFLNYYPLTKDLITNDGGRILPQILTVVLAVSIASTYGSFMKFIAYAIPKDFHFHLSKAFFIRALQEKNETRLLQNYRSGLESYDKFLSRNLKMRFRNIGMILEDALSQKMFIRIWGNDLLRTFDDEPLSPLHYLSNKKRSQQDILVNMSSTDLFKNVIGPIVAVIASTLSLVNSFSGPISSSILSIFH